MSGTTLGTAYVQIVPSAQGIAGSITNIMGGEATSAGEKTGGLFSKMFSSKAAKGFAVAGAALAAGVGVGVSALKKGISETAAYGDNVDKMSQKLGLSTDAYQKWDYVLQLAGTDINSMTTGLKTLTNQFQAAKNGNDASIKAFEQLGISMEDAKNMSREDLFSAAIKGLQGMSDSTERAALANKLFGKSGQNLTPLFNQTAKQTQEQMDLAEKYGMIMPQAAVKASAAFQDSVTTMQMTMTGLKNRMMAEFLPAVTQITDGLGKMFAGDMSGVKDVANGIKAVAAKITQMAPVVLSAAANLGKQLLDGIMSHSGEIGTNMGVLMGKLVQKVVENAPKILAAAAKLIINLAKGLISQLPSVISSVSRIANAIVSGLGSAIWGKVTSAANGIKERFLKPINDLKDKVSGVIKKIKNIFPVSLGKILNFSLPNISVSGGTAPWGIGGKGKKPSFSVSWSSHALGGIFTKPTFLGAGNTIHEFGEAGREAILPLDPFWRKMDEIVDATRENSGSGVTINIYGATDPKAVAREVQSILINDANRRRLAWQ